MIYIFVVNALSVRRWWFWSVFFFLDHVLRANLDVGEDSSLNWALKKNWARSKSFLRISPDLMVFPSWVFQFSSSCVYVYACLNIKGLVNSENWGGKKANLAKLRCLARPWRWKKFRGSSICWLTKNERIVSNEYLRRKKTPKDCKTQAIKWRCKKRK